jgi:RNA polymerase-binding transcription factor DksA
MSKPKKPAPKAAAKKPSAAKPAAKKPAPAPTKKVAPAKKPAAPAKKAAPASKTAIKKPAPVAKAKPVPVKKSVPAKPAPKAAAKAPAKPEAKKPVPAKAAPVKTPIKPAAKAPVAPVKSVAPAKKGAPVKVAPGKAPGKKGPVMNHDVAVKTLTDHRVKHQQEAPTNKKSRRNSPLAFSLDDIDEYLKLRAGMKMNLYVPGQDEAKVAAAKVAAKVAAKPEVKPVANRQVTAVSVADLLGFNPFTKKSGDTSPEEELIPQKFRKYYKLLLDLRDHVNEGLATHTEEALKKTGKDDTGDVSAYSQHMADAGTDSFDRDFALSLVNNEQEALYEIAEAIDRMKDGTYGTCEITQKAIPHDRLVAVPFTRYSAEGQRQIEKTKRRGRRANGNPMLEINEGVGFGTSGGDEGDSEEP